MRYELALSLSFFNGNCHIDKQSCTYLPYPNKKDIFITYLLINP